MKDQSEYVSCCVRRSTPGCMAFTLIELLVVIAIIGLLAAILVPALSKGVQSAKKASCASNLRQVGLGMVPYTMDHKNRIPIRGGPSTDSFWMWDAGAPTYLGYLYAGKYVSDYQVFYCPGQDIRADYFITHGKKKFQNQQWGTANVLGTYVQRGEIILLGEEPRAVAACCRHWNNLIPHASKGPNVLYFDGSVRSLTGNQDNNFRPYEGSTIAFWEAADEN